MIDLFGLGKQPEPHEPAAGASAPEPAAEAPAPRGSHKLWAFLLVLDAVFVIVFAGTVAAKVYQYWRAPAAPSVASPRKRPVKPVEAPAASTAPAPAPEPVKAPEPPKPAPVAAAKPSPDAPRPPKPSMLVEAPKHRETPKLSEAGSKADDRAIGRGSAASAVSQEAAGKVKAIRTEFKVHAPNAKAVELVGAFIVRGGRKDMAKQDDGAWTVTLYLNPGSYRYFFSVDKKKQLDPENPNSDKGLSLLAVP